MHTLILFDLPLHAPSKNMSKFLLRIARQTQPPPCFKLYTTMPSLTHTDKQGNARMVDVTDKETTKRTARAQAVITFPPSTFKLLHDQKKGDVLTVAQIAGIQAAKATSTLIPLCHPVPVTHASVQFQLHEQTCSLTVTSSTSTNAGTGIEMEALTACSIAALTVYDMCKAGGKGIIIRHVRLLEKTGGRSGTYHVPDDDE